MTITPLSNAPDCGHLLRLPTCVPQLSTRRVFVFSMQSLFSFCIGSDRAFCSRCAFLTISQKYNASICSSRRLLMIPILFRLVRVLLTLISSPVSPGQFLRTDRQRTVIGRTWTLLVRMLSWIRIHIRPSTLYFMICTNRWRSVLCTLSCCICGLAAFNYVYLSYRRESILILSRTCPTLQITQFYLLSAPVLFY